MGNMPPECSDSDRTLIDAYNCYARKSVNDFYATVMNSSTNEPVSERGLVGLLTFPNSGTSWFLQLTQAATGILNHTAYEHESVKTKGRPSRGVFLLNAPNGRRPSDTEPSMVKSHVTHYSDDSPPVALTNLHRFRKEWQKNIPNNCSRHIRLLRNPFDNIRARYHLYLLNSSNSKDRELMEFHTFVRNDLRRYLLWHTLCNEVCNRYPLLTVRYANLLDPEKSKDTLFQALKFAGYDIGPDDVRRALLRFPSKYGEVDGIPVHLQHFTVNDIQWISRELRRWIGALDDARNSFGQALRRLVDQLVRP